MVFLSPENENWEKRDKIGRKSLTFYNSQDSLKTLCFQNLLKIRNWVPKNTNVIVFSSGYKSDIQKSYIENIFAQQVYLIASKATLPNIVRL